MQNRIPSTLGLGVAESFHLDNELDLFDFSTPLGLPS